MIYTIILLYSFLLECVFYSTVWSTWNWPRSVFFVYLMMFLIRIHYVQMCKKEYVLLLFTGLVWLDVDVNSTTYHVNRSWINLIESLPTRICDVDNLVVDRSTPKTSRLYLASLQFRWLRQHHLFDKVVSFLYFVKNFQKTLRTLLKMNMWFHRSS